MGFEQGPDRGPFVTFIYKMTTRFERARKNMPWIDIPKPVEADTEDEEAGRRFEGRLDGLYGAELLLGPDTKVLDAHLRLYSTLMEGGGGLVRPTRELIALSVSSALGCARSIAIHGAALNEYWKDAEAVDAFAADPAGAILPPRARRLVDYALKLTRDPGGMVESDVQGLRQAGLSDAEILQTAQIAAYTNFIARLMLGLGMAREY